MYGLIDLNGQVILPFEYDSLSGPTCGLICCCKTSGGKFGYLDLSGNAAIPFQYDMAVRFDSQSHTAWTFMKSVDKIKYTLIDCNGKAINKIPYDDIAFPFDNRIRFKYNSLYGFFDLNGDVVIPPRYNKATDFSNGLAAINVPDKYNMYQFIDVHGRLSLGPYRGLVAHWCKFKSGLALLQDQNASPVVYSEKDLPTRYVNTNGEIAIELSPHLRGSPFFYGFAVVHDLRKNLYGFINSDGHYLIEPSLQIAEPFHQGYAWVKLHEDEFFIDACGNRVLCPKGYKITKNYPSCSRMSVFDQFGKCGVADLVGNILVHATYETVYSYSEGFAVAML